MMTQFIRNTISIVTKIAPIDIKCIRKDTTFFCTKLIKNFRYQEENFLLKEFKFNINEMNMNYTFIELIKDIYLFIDGGLDTEENQSLIIFYYENRQAKLLYVNMGYDIINIVDYIKQIETNLNKTNKTLRDEVDISKIWVYHFTPHK